MGPLLTEVELPSVELSVSCVGAYVYPTAVGAQVGEEPPPELGAEVPLPFELGAEVELEGAALGAGLGAREGATVAPGLGPAITYKSKETLEPNVA